MPGPNPHVDTSADYEQFENEQLAQDRDAAGVATADVDDATAGRLVDDLTDADLSDADLSGADLSDSNLGEADLSGADLSDTDLGSADLSEANFIQSYPT